MVNPDTQEPTTSARPTAPQILIAGLGYLGSALALHFQGLGWQVTGLRRSPTAHAAALPVLSADLCAPATLAPLRHQAFDYLVYCPAPTISGPVGYQQTYVDGLRNLLAAVDLQRVRRIVFTSSTGVYAQNDGTWVDETSPTTPSHYTGQIMRAAEDLLHAAAPTAVVARLSGIYGPGRTGILDRLRSGQECLYAGTQRYMNFIHRDDAVGAVHHLLSLPRPAPTYIVSDGAPASRDEVLLWLAEALKLAPPSLSMTAVPPGFRGNKRCSNKLLVDSGYGFCAPDFRAGYRRIFGPELAGLD